MADLKDIAHQAEAVVGAALQKQGFAVTNLNELAENCPFMDLLARKGNDRVLVQVKGTTTAVGKYATPPGRAHALAAFADALDCHAIYGFVHLVDADPIVRFAIAEDVAVLAEEDEAEYSGTNRYHVNIGQFAIAASQLDELLNLLSPEGLAPNATSAEKFEEERHPGRAGTDHGATVPSPGASAGPAVRTRQRRSPSPGGAVQCRSYWAIRESDPAASTVAHTTGTGSGLRCVAAPGFATAHGGCLRPRYSATRSLATPLSMALA